MPPGTLEIREIKQALRLKRQRICLPLAPIRPPSRIFQQLGHGILLNDGIDYPQFGAEQPNLSDLSLGKADTPDPVVAGDALTYTLIATNATTGTNLATGVFVTDTLPPRVTFKSATPSQGATRPVTGSTVVWDVGELFWGQSETLEIVTTVEPSTPEGTVLTNTAVINGDQEDPVQGNNTATAITLVQVTDFQVEPSFDLYQDPLDGAIGLKVDVAQVTSPVTGNGAEVLLGAFQVQLTYDGTCVHILALREMDFPIIAENINNHAGVTNFNRFATEGIAAPLDLGHALTRMIGNVHQNCAVAMRVVDLRDLDGNIVGVAPSNLSVALLRGDARADGDVNIADALFIAQYLVGLRPACTSGLDTTCLHSVNAASVRQDGAFDQKTIADALFIAQYLVGLRDEFYSLVNALLAGKFITKLGRGGSGDGNFIQPHHVAVDGSGNVYVVDTDNNRIQVFDSVGIFITKWGSICNLEFLSGCVDPDGPGPLENGDGQFFLPHGVSVADSGGVYVADRSNNRIQKFVAVSP